MNRPPFPDSWSPTLDQHPSITTRQTSLLNPDPRSLLHARWSIHLVPRFGLDDLSFMLRRIAILTLVLCGTLASLFTPMQDTPQWGREYSIVALRVSIPIQTSESESRKRPVTSVASTVPKRQLRRVVVVTCEAPKRVPERPRAPQLPYAPLSPELPPSSPRAPPAVC